MHVQDRQQMSRITHHQKDLERAEAVQAGTPQETPPSPTSHPALQPDFGGSSAAIAAATVSAADVAAAQEAGRPAGTGEVGTGGDR